MVGTVGGSVGGAVGGGCSTTGGSVAGGSVAGATAVARVVAVGFVVDVVDVEDDVVVDELDVVGPRVVRVTWVPRTSTLAPFVGEAPSSLPKAA